MTKYLVFINVSEYDRQWIGDTCTERIVIDTKVNAKELVRKIKSKL